MRTRTILGGLTSTLIAAAGLTGLPLSSVAVAAGTPTTTPITVTPASGLLSTTETRATGHNDFEADGLHVWTEAAASTDKAAGYLATDVPLADVGEPTMDWTLTDPALPAVPGKQLVVDFDADGSPDGILVGEPVYGDDWWLSGSAQQLVKDAAPSHTGGSGSDNHGTLAQWRAAFATARVLAVGYSLGSGVHGDGTITSLTVGDRTYRFARGIGACFASIDATTRTYTLTQDCSTLDTIHVPDGWTLDGAGHTLTAVEDAEHLDFPGPVVVSATGTDSGPAAMDVRDLDITTAGFDHGSNSGGTLAGIRFDRAGGAVSHVSIIGVTHGNGVQEGLGLYVRNKTADGDIHVPIADISVDHVAVDRYQKGGIVFDGNTVFTMTHSVVGRSSDAAGNPVTGIGANAVQVSRSARGSITDSSIGLNEYDPVPTPGDGSDATGVLVYDARHVDLARDVVSGGDGDVAVDVYNASGVDQTVVDVSCSVFSRTPDPGDYDPYGFGIAQWDDGSFPTQVTLSDSTFVGWKQATATLHGSVPGLVAEPGALNQHLGGCAPLAPHGIRVSGGDGETDVTWQPATAPAYAPLTGYTVKVGLQRVHVGPNATSAHVEGLSNRDSYRVTVAAESQGGRTPAPWTLFPTHLGLTTTDSAVAYGHTATLKGTLRSDDRGAALAHRPVVIQRKTVGGSWHRFTTVRAHSSGGFHTTVRPRATTRYRAVYAGAPDLASRSHAVKIGVAPRVRFQLSDRSVRPGDRVLFTGDVTPARAGDAVLLQRQVGVRWRTFATHALNRHTTYTFRFTPGRRFDFRWRVVKRADGRHIQGTSREISLRVG